MKYDDLNEFVYALLSCVDPRPISVLSPHSFSCFFFFFIFFLARFIAAVSIVSISLVRDSSIVATCPSIPAARFAF